MIQRFVDAWFAGNETLRAKWTQKTPSGYAELIRDVVALMPGMDQDRIHEINDGDYQGTLLYVIGAEGYQPSTYWTVSVSYGSCSGCDTLQALADEGSDKGRVDGLMTLGLHVVQGLRQVSGAEQ